MDNNQYLDVTSTPTPDPWICRFRNKFYLTFTGNDRIPLWDAISLADFHDRPNRGLLWSAQSHGHQSQLLWAPELHCLRGRWYIYFAAADSAVGNRSHRMYVLGGPSEKDEPRNGSWELLGPINHMDQRQWAIDGTVFEIDGTLYMAYSGWPKRGDGGNEWETQNEQLQQLFIIRLRDPVTASSEPVMISEPTNSWERLPETNIAINEGPQWLEAPGGHWRGLVYSCSASWTKHYKMATLRYLPENGSEPLNHSSWKKSRAPLLQNRPDGKGPYGPGHGCFLHLGSETFAVFHATDRDTDGNSNRRCRMQRVQWTDSGPDMGLYVGHSAVDAEKVFGRLEKHGEP